MYIFIKTRLKFKLRFMATLTNEWRATERLAPSLVNVSGGIFNPGAWFFQQNNTPLPTDKYIIIKGHDTFFSIWYYDISEFQLYSTIYGDNNTRRREVLVCLQSSTLVLVPILCLVPDTVEFWLLSSIVCVTVCWYAVDGVDGWVSALLLHDNGKSSVTFAKH